MRRVRLSPLALGVASVASVALGAAAQRAGDAWIPAGGGPISVGVAAEPGALDARACGACHEAHYREWRRSAHARSFHDPLFAAELRERPLPSCVRCHAPRGDHAAGVDCAACHVRDGVVHNPTVSGAAPHESRVAPALADVRACAPCHEFDFDGQPGERLQRTVTEWSASQHADTPCQGCHLPPREDGHRAHHFPGGLDAALLRDAIEVRNATLEPGDGVTRVRFELAARGAGHAVPTGDLFRRVEVRAWPAGRPARAARAILARRFRVAHGRFTELDDRRVPAVGARTVTLELDGTHARVAYAIELWRTSPERARAHRWPERDVRRRLAEGVLTR